MNRFALTITLALQALAALPTLAQDQSAATSNTSEREIIVQFAPGTVSLPPGQTKVSPEQATFQVSAVEDVLSIYNAENGCICGAGRTLEDLKR